MAAGEIDIFGKLVARTAAGKICNAEQVDGLDEKIAASITPPEKEVINVLTASDTAPVSAHDEDLYINTDENCIYTYSTEDGWYATVEAQQDVVYITLDNSHIYVYDGAQFVDKTNEVVDNTLYVQRVVPTFGDVEMPDGTIVEGVIIKDGLWNVIEPGLYNVCMNSRTWYTLLVTVTRRVGRGRTTTYYSQILQDKEGYMMRSRVNDGDWSAGEDDEGHIISWSEFTYADTGYVDTKVATEAGNRIADVLNEAQARSNADTAEATARAAADDEILDLLYACF